MKRPRFHERLDAVIEQALQRRVDVVTLRNVLDQGRGIRQRGREKQPLRMRFRCGGFDASFEL